MKQINFNDMICSEINFSNIIAIELCWKANFKYSYQEKARSENGIILVLSDNVVFCQDSNTISSRTGDILYIPAGTKYYVQCKNDDTIMQLINFTVTDLSGEQIVFSDKIIKIISHKKTLFKNSFSDLLDTYIKSVSNKLIVKIKFLKLLLQIIEYNKKPDNYSPIHNAVTYINNNLVCDIKIPELAKICAMSESTLRREFRRILGVTPVEYINFEKIKKAKNMLCHDSLTVNDISNALSFYDEAYFCKTFKNVTGITPTEYRKMYINQE